jgi:exopolysaccharide biosynthesis polyprenyl glycosylphosphotransferase
MSTLLEKPQLASPASQNKVEQLSQMLSVDYGLADVNYNTAHMRRMDWPIKRLFDRSTTFVGVICISPLLLLIILLIKMDSKGPILFKQERIGLKGKTFQMYKFRSMHTDAEERLAQLLKYNETNGGMFKMTNDPRVTRIGRFLRKYSLDELPQLFNVLRGEMSLVGPRPPLMREVENYEPWHYVRFATLPGLTGLWQVSGRSNIQDFDSVVTLDAHYIKQWNFLLDLKLLIKTVPVVLFGKDTA